MFIPLEGENIICLANVVAIYRKESGSTILKRDGTTATTSFTPPTLSRRGALLAKEGASRLKSGCPRA